MAINIVIIIYQMIKVLYKNNYFFRYLLSSIFAFLLTVLLVFLLQIVSFISLEIAFLITQVAKAFAFFFIQKYFTFKSPNRDTIKELRFYTYTIIISKSLEFLMMLLLNLIAINYLINIFFVLSLSSLIKYFVFKLIFTEKDIY
jgi:hypothetical protein